MSSGWRRGVLMLGSCALPAGGAPEISQQNNVVRW
jgi:hypothetical protein